MKSIRMRGISFDGLLPNVLHIIHLKGWDSHMFHAITKHGHTYENSQLRGKAVAPLLAE